MGWKQNVTVLILVYGIVPFLISCSEGGNSERMAPVDNVVDTVSVPRDTLTYLALGDSYTIGESVAERDRWPVQLTREFNRSDWKVVIGDPEIIAQTGWTTQELKSAIDKRVIAKDYDLVSLLIGVNNQYRGYPLEDYPAEFETLLNMAISFAGNQASKVFVVSIPDYGYTPFGGGNQQKISEEIDAYNEINRRISSEKAVKYFDITAISREGLQDPTLVAPDRLHPSGRQYRRWVQKIMEDASFATLFDQ